MYHPIIIVNELKDKSSGVSGQSSHPPVLGEQGENFIHEPSFWLNTLILHPIIEFMYMYTHMPWLCRIASEPRPTLILFACG